MAGYPLPWVGDPTAVPSLHSRPLISPHPSTLPVPPALQIYSVLEEQADALSRQAGHGAYIFEAAASNTRKMASFMV